MSHAEDAAKPDVGPGVETRYYDDGSHQSFHIDVIEAFREAHFAKDTANSDQIWRLWLSYFEELLPSLGSGRLIDRLENQHVWRRHEGWPIFKTADTPCLAFTATVDSEEDKVTLVALGLCYRYPSGDEDVWWRNVILPRVRSL